MKTLHKMQRKKWIGYPHHFEGLLTMRSTSTSSSQVIPDSIIITRRSPFLRDSLIVSLILNHPARKTDI